MAILLTRHLPGIKFISTLIVKKKVESKMTESALRARKPKEHKQDRQNLLPLSMPEADRPYIIYVREYQRVRQK
jgi:hypothetical protein